jgi:hypothetical protein
LQIHIVGGSFGLQRSVIEAEIQRRAPIQQRLGVPMPTASRAIQFSSKSRIFPRGDGLAAGLRRLRSFNRGPPQARSVRRQSYREFASTDPARKA